MIFRSINIIMKLFEKLDQLNTEKINSQTKNIYKSTSYELVETISKEYENISQHLNNQKEQLTELLQLCQNHIKNNNKIFVVAAGYTGSLILMALEHYNRTVSSSPIIPIVPGISRPFEDHPQNIEDISDEGEIDTKNLEISKKDLLIAFSVSGRTPYTIGSIRYAQSIGCSTACVCCNHATALSGIVDYTVEIDSGSEVLLGATYIKSSTVLSAVLNIIISSVMINTGKIYYNLPLDINIRTYQDLYRAVKTIVEITNCTQETAEMALELSQNHIKTSIVMIVKNYTNEQAKKYLSQNNFFDIL